MSLRRIVAVSKNPEVQQLAQKYSQEVFGADDLTDALDVVQTKKPDLILFDHLFKPEHISDYISRADNNSTNIPIVVIGNNDSSTALDKKYVQVGAYDYLKGKQDYNRLEQIISNIKDKSDKSTGRFFAKDIAGFVSMVGHSKAMLDTLRMIRLVAASQCNPVLIVGETGTGKELVARAIHFLRHPKEPFVAINCAALTANLLESELFGHEKGSFTGANREKTGLLELAGSGTLLLDEISEMPIDLQAKLLRVLQEKSFRKVGGIKDITCNATIIASSNRNLKKEVQSNRFRRDLYYRLNVFPVSLAPLRSKERRQDIRLLAEYFIHTSNICPDKRGKIKSMTELAIEALEKHDWPGNVRELRNVIERAILLETTDKIGLNGIIINPTEWNEESDNTSTGIIKDFSLAKAERELIARALQKTGWQKTRAAVLLGITRATLYAKVKQYNIEKDSSMADSSAEESQEEVSLPSLSEPITA